MKAVRITRHVFPDTPFCNQRTMYVVNVYELRKNKSGRYIWKWISHLMENPEHNNMHCFYNSREQADRTARRFSYKVLNRKHISLTFYYAKGSDFESPL